MVTPTVANLCEGEARIFWGGVFFFNLVWVGGLGGAHFLGMGWGGGGVYFLRFSLYRHSKGREWGRVNCEQFQTSKRN